MRSIPALIVPFRMIRAEYFVLRTLPLIASLNPIVLVEGNRRNLVRLWLCAEIRVLRFDLLHLLRIGLGLLPARHLCLRVLLAGCRACWSCACGRRRCRSSGCHCVRPMPLFTFSSLLHLFLCPGRRSAGRLTGNICCRLGAGLRFRVAFPPLCPRWLVRRTGGGFRFRRHLGVLPL